MSLLIYGAGGHASVVSELAGFCGYVISAYAVDPEHYMPRRNGGPPMVSGDDAMLKEIYDSGIKNAVVAIGDCKSRSLAIERLTLIGFDLVTLVHPAASVSPSASLGHGSVVCAGAIVCAKAKLGDGVIVNTGASVDHDCQVWSYAHLSPGVRLSGGVKIGAGAWVGAGAVVIDHLTIGSWSVIGAGSVVTRDIPTKIVAYGIPAQEMRQIA